MSIEKLPSSPDTAVATEPSSPIPGIARTWSMGSYPKLSNLMGRWPDVTIFRRFGDLNAQNLLFLQAEISHLEEELRQVREQEEKNEDIKGITAQRSWFQLSNTDDDDEPCKQWRIIQDIRKTMKEYNEFLLQYRDICALQNPSKHDLNTLRRWLKHGKCGDNFLLGVERNIFHLDEDDDHPCEDRTSDLVTLSPQAVERDFFSRWVTDEVLDKFHSCLGHRFKKPIDVESGMFHYRNSHLRGLSHLVGVFLASVIPAASIFTLYFVTDMIDRLGVLFAYSALFSICLAVFTSAKRIEIFAATAAYVTFMSILATSGLIVSPQ